MESATATGTATTSGTTINPTTTIHGKYTIGPLLGEGSFAKVYHCRSLKTNSSVAIKVTTKSNANKSMAPYILREITAMRRLNHPNIIQIHELLATKTRIYLVIELARGGDLQTLLSRRQGHRLPLPKALRIFHQLVSALDFCHQHGVTHRDLKPHNILLDQQGNVKLSDFGLSAVSGEGSAPTSRCLLKSRCGTLVFMAPEVMEGERYDGAKTDSWSCGVILYEMLVGALPFNPSDVVELMGRKMRGREFRLPSYLILPMRALIYHLLDPNPRTRLCIGEIAKESSSWFDGFVPKSKPLEDLVRMNEGHFERGSSVNAFDIIGSGYGLDISGMFDVVVRRKRRGFRVNERAVEVAERVVEVGGRLGYEVIKSGNDCKIWLRRGSLLLMVEVLEAATELSMVDVVVVEGRRCGPCGGDDSGATGGGQSGMIGDIEEVLYNYIF